MSWSVTLNDVWKDIPINVVEYFATQHPLYPQDMLHAQQLARKSGFASVVLTGFRTPSPYGDDEVVDISVRGLMKAEDYQAAIKRFIEAGPDAG